MPKSPILGRKYPSHRTSKLSEVKFLITKIEQQPANIQKKSTDAIIIAIFNS